MCNPEIYLAGTCKLNTATVPRNTRPTHRSFSANTTRKMLRAKIHRAKVTDADLDYEGSLTIPPELMQLADIKEFEAVHVWNVNRRDPV